MKYVVFTFSGEGLGIAKRLQDEGNDVLVAMIHDIKDILTKEDDQDKEEEDVEKIRRLSSYDGMVDKEEAWKVVETLKRVKNPKEYFLFFDFNHCFKFSEALMGLGFHGNFVTEEDRLLETSRDKAKDFVKQHYADLKVAEVHEFKTADEGKQFLEETEDCWVLKGMDEDARTVVPSAEDPELAKQELIEALDKEGSSYEKGGYILELRIPNIIEITPELQFYDGKPLWASIDIELKQLGAGNVSVMTGCAADLVFPIELDSPIIDLAFPPIVHQMAKEHGGWFTWDASILYDADTGEPYFGEFCANRPGYDCTITELSLFERVTDFFEAIVAGENPMKKANHTFAASVRLFNLKRDGERHLLKDAPINTLPGSERDFWPYDAKMKDGKLVTAGYTWDIGIVTGSGDDIEEAAEDCYRNLELVSVEGVYYRPLHDYLSIAYPGSIPNRYEYLKNRTMFRHLEIEDKEQEPS